jgi:Helix-turn-helix domain
MEKGGFAMSEATLDQVLFATNKLQETVAELKRMVSQIQTSAPPIQPKWYSTCEFATTLGRSEFTVREWCRLGRIHAEKRACGRGSTREWMISASELQRVRDEGLLPDPNKYLTANMVHHACSVVNGWCQYYGMAVGTEECSEVAVRVLRELCGHGVREVYTEEHVRKVLARARNQWISVRDRSIR